MPFKDYKCQNCGANININNTNVAYCEFCGSQIARVKKLPSEKDCIDKAIHEFSSRQYKQCEETIRTSLYFFPKNNDLLLLRAIIKKDKAFLSPIDKDKLSDKVLDECRKVFDKWEAIIDYYIPWDLINTKSIEDVDDIGIIGNGLDSNKSAIRCFAFVEYLYDIEYFKQYKLKIIELDSQEREHATRLLNMRVSKFKYDLKQAKQIMIISSIILLISILSLIIGASGTFSFILFFAGIIGMGIGGNRNRQARNYRDVD
ncbi:MAG: hypothetical protein KAQ68_02635 [Clostridiales bacterium]|nr:hypothetical protein [Clostridiales bacterium]